MPDRRIRGGFRAAEKDGGKWGSWPGIGPGANQVPKDPQRDKGTIVEEGETRLWCALP